MLRRIPKSILLWGSGVASALIFGAIVEYMDLTRIAENASLIEAWNLSGNASHLKYFDTNGGILVELHRNRTNGKIVDISVAKEGLGELFVFHKEEKDTYEVEYSGGRLGSLRVWWDMNGDGFWDKRLIERGIDIRLKNDEWLKTNKIEEMIADTIMGKFEFNINYGRWEPVTDTKMEFQFQGQ